MTLFGAVFSSSVQMRNRSVALCIAAINLTDKHDKMVIVIRQIHVQNNPIMVLSHFTEIHNCTRLYHWWYICRDDAEC